MKKILITTLIMFSIASVQAQSEPGDERGRKHGGKHRGDPITHMTEKLGLSDEQALEVATIFEESRAQHKAIQDSVRDEHCAVHEETMLELSTVLSEDQMAEFDALQSKRKNSGRQHGMPRFANCDS